MIILIFLFWLPQHLVSVYCLTWVEKGIMKGKAVNCIFMRAIVWSCTNLNSIQRLTTNPSLFLKLSGMKASNFPRVECLFIASCTISAFGRGSQQMEVCTRAHH